MSEFLPLVQLLGEFSSECGYCHSNRNNAFGIFARDMESRLYDKLINRNWRRSGDLMYSPQNSTICCPQYAIRLRASAFYPQKSKHHRKVMNRLERFLNTGSTALKTEKRETSSSSSVDAQNNAEVAYAVAEEIKRAVGSLFESESIVALSTGEHGFDMDRMVKVTTPKKRVHGHVDLSCNIVLVMMGLYRKHKIQQAQFPKQIAEMLVRHMHVDQLHGVNNMHVEENGFINIELSGDKKQKQEENPHGQEQTQQSKNKNKKKKKKKKKNVEGVTNQTKTEPRHRLTLEINPAEVKDDEYELYKKYQITIHHDEPSSVNREQYDDFLCSSSLVLQEKEEGNDDHRQYPLKGYGTYHVRYMLDSTKLLAVSVVDVLPTGWSSVYFFYDPDYSDLSLGVVSAIKEIELVRQESLRIPEFQYMYLGYYIHSCQKMRYKAQYEPSELLCQETLTWVPFSDVKPKLDEHRYCKFASGDVPTDSDLQCLHADSQDTTRPDIFSDLIFLVQGQLVTAGILLQRLRLTDVARDKIGEFHALASHNIAKEFVHVLSVQSDLQQL